MAEMLSVLWQHKSRYSASEEPPFSMLAVLHVIVKNQN